MPQKAADAAATAQEVDEQGEEAVRERPRKSTSIWGTIFGKAGKRAGGGGRRLCRDDCGQCGTGQEIARQPDAQCRDFGGGFDRHRSGRAARGPLRAQSHRRVDALIALAKRRSGMRPYLLAAAVAASALALSAQPAPAQQLSPEASGSCRTRACSKGPAERGRRAFGLQARPHGRSFAGNLFRQGADRSDAGRPDQLHRHARPRPDGRAGERERRRQDLSGILGAAGRYGRLRGWHFGNSFRRGR